MEQSHPSPKNGHPITKHCRITEEQRATLLLGSFQVQNSKGWYFLSHMISEPISLAGLVSLATVFSELIKVPIGRDYIRRKELVVKWFDENIEKILPWKNCVQLNYITYGEKLKLEQEKEIARRI